MSSGYYAEIVEFTTDKIVKRMGPMSERRAFKACYGAAINLDHEKFYTRVVCEEEKGVEVSES